jgi:hypothetical protein
MTSGGDEIRDTVEQRANIYGDFTHESIIAMGLKNVLRYEWSDDLTELKIRDGWARLEPYQQHGLELICLKLARTVNGDGGYLDSYRDIAGYCTLIMDRLVKEGNGHG